MHPIENILDFMVEVEQLKGIQRKSKPVGLDRYENSAEHSWHVCLSALMLKEYADEDIEIDRVIKMLLIHDLGEIVVGDTIIYASETPALKAKEAAGVDHLLRHLSDEKRAAYMALWVEFEAGETADSRYARAVDRVPPLLQNLLGDGHGWKTNKIAKEKVFALNGRIGEGSTLLWQVLEKRLHEAVAAGILT